MRRKILGMVILLVLLASVGAGAKPTIRYATSWLQRVGGSEWEKQIYAYADAVKDKVTFKWEITQGDDLRTKIKTDLAANNLPDVFNYWTRGSLKTMVDAGKLMEVHDYLKNSKVVKWEDFPFDDWAAYSLDGGKNVYGFPIEGSTAFMLANKKLFAKYNLKYPKTEAELLAVSKVFNANGIVPLAIGSKGGNPAHFWVGEIFYQLAGDAQGQGFTNGTVKYTTPEMLRTAQLIEEQRKAGVFPKDTLANGDFGPAVALYNEGKAAMIMSFPWMISTFSKDIVAGSDYIYAPAMPGAKNLPTSFIVGGANHGLVVNAASYKDPAKQAALTDFLDFFLSDKQMNLLASTLGLWVDKNMTLDEKMLSPLYVMTGKGVRGKNLWINLWTRMPDPTTAEVFSTAADELWAGTITPQGYVDEVQKSLDDYFASNK